ncbi:MAG TPA: RDD family protein, partial [Pyrinomonadaceae bacterium]|nr:RDD family protein [Pyrinomonadaceae bacterium]
EKGDTNKLPPLDTITRTPLASPEAPVTTEESRKPEFAKIKRIHIPAEHVELESSDVSAASDAIEDLAPMSMRFGAGLFDLIIGVFAGMLLLSPIAFTGSDWFSMAGLAAFAGATSIFLFLYMTICLGFFGKTMGMRLFSLELVDAVENEYPTLRQAAANSALFLLTLPFAGAGFLTLFYNEEKRAVHDLLSGTILVREF